MLNFVLTPRSYGSVQFAKITRMSTRHHTRAPTSLSSNGMLKDVGPAAADLLIRRSSHSRKGKRKSNAAMFKIPRHAQTEIMRVTTFF